MPHFKEIGLIFFCIIAAVIIAGAVAVFDVHQSSDIERVMGNGFTVVAQGAEAAAFDRQVNYRITSQQQYEELWNMLYTEGMPMPSIDFSTQELYAIFGGSHSASGYGVMVDSVTEDEGVRTVHITYTEPDPSCSPTGSASSPFILIQIERSTVPVTHAEQTITSACR